MKTQEHIIWQNYDLNPEDFSEELNEIPEDRKYEVMEEINYDYLETEKMNLDIPLKSKIICLADIGLWNGRRSGYRIMGNNVNDIFTFFNDCDYAEWKCTSKDVICKQSHHDGTHYVTFRKFKDKLSSEQIENFLEKILCGKVDNRTVSYYTESLRPYVANVYGW